MNTPSRNKNMDKYNKTKRDLIENAMRSTVFDAAVKILEEDGPDGLQMQRIAARAGVSIGSLYNYFKDKDELLFFVHDKLCEEFFSMVSHEALSNLRPDKKIIELIRQVFSFVAMNKDIFEFLELSEVFKKAKEQNRFEHQQQFVEIFARVLAQGVEEKIFSGIDPSKTADLLHSCIVGIFKVKTELKSFQPQQDGEEFIKMFSAYLGITEH